MSHLTRWISSLTLAAAAATTVAPASASLVLDLNTGGTAVPCGGCGANGTTYGWAFRVINPVSINQLGVWDSGADGLGVASVQAGLWTAGGALLASATITNASDQVASASADGEWLFEDIGSLVLAPGSYVIGSLFFNAAPTAQVNAPFTAIADIAVTGGVEGTIDGGFARPDNSFSLIFGPTMRLAQVPEPTGLALVGLGLALAGLSRRRAMAQAA